MIEPIGSPRDRMAQVIIFLVIMLLWVGTSVVPASASPIIIPADELGYGEIGVYEGMNTSINATHFHRETIYFPVEIPLWFWSVIAAAGLVFLALSFLWRGAINVTVISAWVALFLVEVAQWTAFMIRDTVVAVSFLSQIGAVNNITIWSVIHPAVVATDYMIPFWGMFPFTVIAILNVIAVSLEIGRPGLNTFPRRPLQ